MAEVSPFAVFLLVLLVGYVAAQLTIRSRPLLGGGAKRYVMTVRHHGVTFTCDTQATSKREAEEKLHHEIRQQILEAGLDPHDGTTDYRLFGEAFGAPQPENVIVFQPGRREQDG